MVKYPEGAACYVPKIMDEDEAKVFRMLHGMMCERGHGRPDDASGEKCQGRVTIDHNGVTLSCPRCGDARRVYPPVVNDANSS